MSFPGRKQLEFLADSNSSASLGVELQLQQLSFTVQTLGESVHLIEKLSNQVQDLLVLQRHAHDVVDRGGNSVQGGKDSDVAEEEDERPEGPLEEFDKALVESQSVKSEPRQYDRQVSDVSGLSLASLRNLSRQSTLVEDHGMEISERPNKARSFPTKLSQTSCNLDCGCICHKRNRLKSPAVLSTALGSLFVGYKASPWSSQNCDKKYCRSSTTKITYAFPQWLLRRVISVSMAYSHPQGPNFCLRMIRVRPGNANIFTAVFRGTCNHVQRLLCDEEASVLDVDPSHNTALQVRLISFVHRFMSLR